MIVTTLATRAFTGSGSLYDVLRTVTTVMPRFVNEQNGTYAASNTRRQLTRRIQCVPRKGAHLMQEREFVKGRAGTALKTSCWSSSRAWAPSTRRPS